MDLNTTQLQEVNKFMEYDAKANQRRGEILNRCITMERMLDGVLAKYFCLDDDKKQEFLGLVLYTGKLGFKAKVTIFKTLFKDKFDDIKEDVEENIKTCFKILDKRNALAHRSLDMTNYLDGTAGDKSFFKEPHGNAVGIDIDEKYFTEIINDILSCSLFFYKIFQRI